MIAVNNFEDFAYMFNKLKDKRELFAFLLFDDRESHESIKRYATRSFKWLDSLAIRAKIFFFAFVPFDHESGSSNPSPRVASLFGIDPNRLPGIVLFTMLDTKDGAEDSTYYPLKSELFEKDPTQVEKVFADLFTEITHCTASGLKSDQLLREVKYRVESIQRREKMRPIAQYFLELGETAIAIPKDFLSNIGAAFAQAAAGK
ncbi:MAG: hypothetical protein ACE5KZ_10815 [Candidatus Scalinduaceae bacterium]